MTAAEIVAGLACSRPACDCTRAVRKGQGATHCPGHADQTPSLSVSERNGVVLVKCMAGCPQEAVIAALRDRGLWRPERASRNGHVPPGREVPRYTCRYEIRALDGELVAIHHRAEYADGRKSFTWNRPDGQVGLGGAPVAELPLYRSETLADLPPAAPVVLVEGEKAADRLASVLGAGVGVVATVTGAAATPSDEVLATIADRRVLLWPDADEVGRSHMARIAERLQALGCPSVKMVDWPDAPEHGDAADFVASHDRAETVKLLKSAAPWERQEDVESAERPAPRFALTAAELCSTEETAAEDAVVPGFLVASAITELDAPPKAGKTTFELAMVKAVTEGGHFLGHPCRQGPVILVSEEGRATLREAITRAGLASSTDLYVVSGMAVRRHPWAELVATVLSLAQGVGAVAVFVDTLAACAGLDAEAENDAGAALAAVEPLRLVADEGLAVLVLRHDRRAGGAAGESGRGSSAFSGAVDTIFTLRRHESLGLNGRRLQAVSRFEDVPTELDVELTPNGYAILGAPEASGTLMAERAILGVLPASAEDAVTADWVAKMVPRVSPRRARERLEILRDRGQVERLGEGRKGAPHTYCRADGQIPADFPADSPAGSPETASVISIIPADGPTPESAGIFSPRIPAFPAPPKGGVPDSARILHGGLPGQGTSPAPIAEPGSEAAVTPGVEL